MVENVKDTQGTWGVGRLVFGVVLPTAAANGGRAYIVRASPGKSESPISERIGDGGREGRRVPGEVSRGRSHQPLRLGPEAEQFRVIGQVAEPPVLGLDRATRAKLACHRAAT